MRANSNVLFYALNVLVKAKKSLARALGSSKAAKCPPFGMSVRCVRFSLAE